MKLIVDIPEEDYDMLLRTGFLTTYLAKRPLELLRHGIPLDDVKAEIEKHQFSREYCCDHNIDAAIDMSMVRIILNSIGEEVRNK